MNATTKITSYNDTIDSRDVIARIAYLEANETELNDVDARELAALRELAEQGESLEDWNYGVTLVRDSYFETYAQQHAEDVVEGLREASWPFTRIDWEAAAADLQQDYTDLEVDGVTYWAR